MSGGKNGRKTHGSASSPLERFREWIPAPLGSTCGIFRSPARFPLLTFRGMCLLRCSRRASISSYFLRTEAIPPKYPGRSKSIPPMHPICSFLSQKIPQKTAWTAPYILLMVQIHLNITGLHGRMTPASWRITPPSEWFPPKANSWPSPCRTTPPSLGKRPDWFSAKARKTPSRSGRSSPPSLCPLCWKRLCCPLPLFPTSMSPRTTPMSITETIPGWFGM